MYVYVSILCTQTHVTVCPVTVITVHFHDVTPSERRDIKSALDSKRCSSCMESCEDMAGATTRTEEF